MGKVSVLTREQKAILSALGKDETIAKQFYFTGGTALSEMYLHHRESEDLDFFSEKVVPRQHIFNLITKLSREQDFTYTTQFVDPVTIYILTYPHDRELKVDFSFYPYPLLDKPSSSEHGIAVDSLFDIAVNKIVSITQRSEVKDFVDLYYLLKRFTFWDLRDGAKKKFRMVLEPLLVASDMLAAEDFTILPRMIKPLTLDELKAFYRTQAVALGRKEVSFSS